MRIVLDSSVLLAAYVARAGVCAELMEDVLQRHDLILSEYIIHEIEDVLARKFLAPDETIRRVVQSLRAAARMVEPAEVAREACRDPADLPIIGTAVAGNASLLITVDKDLLTVAAHGATKIIRPGQFWQYTAT